MRSTKMTLLALLLGFVALSAVVGGCGSWQPAKEQGKCSEDREWVPPAQDPQSGEWKDGYCKWVDGKNG